MATKETAMERVQDRIETGVNDLQDGLTKMDGRARSLIAAHPVAALLCALGLGYVIARIVTR